VSNGYFTNCKRNKLWACHTPSSNQIPNKMSCTHLIRTVVENCAAKCMRRAKKHQQQHNTMRWTSIYRITVDADSFLNNSDNIYIFFPASCDLDAPRGGSIHIYNIMQVRFHRNIAAPSLAADCNVPQRPPAVKISFTSVQMVHTHTHTHPAAAG